MKKRKRGDVREDGKVFSNYDINGYECWTTTEKLAQNKAVMRACKDRKFSTKEGHAKILIQNRKSIAKKSNIEFLISELDLLKNLPETCPILGIKLSWTTRKGVSGSKDNSPSLDKIDPSKGYVPGNVMWISYLANRMKSNATPDQLKIFANWILTNG